MCGDVLTAVICVCPHSGGVVHTVVVWCSMFQPSLFAIVWCTAYWGRVEVARLLVDAGANVEAKSDKGDTPLHCAGACDGYFVCLYCIVGCGCV